MPRISAGICTQQDQQLGPERRNVEFLLIGFHG
jgi:hypothetical protein